MSNPPSGDRLYRLLPAVYRERDLAAGQPLRALLGVIAEQVGVVERDIERLYENWFIETCDDWVVPYIGDLLGYRVLDDGNDPRDAGVRGNLNRANVLVPRRDVANTIGYRRRKGTLGLLEDLAASVAGWPCRVVEFDRLLVGTQSIKHLRLAQSRTAEVRSAAAMARIGSPFDATAHGVDLRRPHSLHTRGRYNLPSVGLFVWRLRSFSVTRMQAYCIDRSEKACYTFSVLGNDCRLFNQPTPVRTSHRSEEADLPAPLTRAALADAHGRVAERHYGDGRSLAIWRREDGGTHLIPRQELVVADLSDWRVHARNGTVAIDPELGRIAFALGEAPEGGLLVSYHYGFSAAMGGGEYVRSFAVRPAGSVLYSVGPDRDFHTLDEAFQRWQHDKPADAVIELWANDVYTDPKPIALHEHQRLEVRAANDARPLIDLRDRHRDAREFLSVRGAAGSRLCLIGLLVAGRALQLKGHLDELVIRDCTFVPGWEATPEVSTKNDMTPSLRLENVRTRVVVERSVLGPISVINNPVELEPLELLVSDSIIDAASAERRAIDAPERGAAAVRLTVLRSTVIGRVHVNELVRAEDSIFNGKLDVVRRQDGCLRYCFIESGSQTPRRFGCQPDAASAGSHEAEAAAIRARVRPIFNSLRFGTPDYGQLADACTVEISRGAQDGSEMGAFHDLHQGQRLANLQARLDDYVPAGCDVGIFNAT